MYAGNGNYQSQVQVYWRMVGWGFVYLILEFDLLGYVSTGFIAARVGLGHVDVSAARTTAWKT